jgi:hypothetical protein
MRRNRSVLLVPDSRGDAAPPRDAEALATFDSANRGEWWWRQPKWSRREWGLEQDGRLVAVLRGERLFSNTSHVRFADAALAVRRGWTGNAEVRAEGAKEPLARFVSRWSGGGRIEPPAGADPLELVPTGFWKRAYELRTADRLVLVRFESHDRLLRHDVQVLPEDPARRRDDLRLLLALSAAMQFAPKRHSH